MRDLIRFNLPSQLLSRFDGLIHPRSAAREATSLEPAHRGTGNASIQSDLSLGGQPPALALDGEPDRFQRQRSVDTESVVVLEQINLVQGDVGLFHGSASRKLGGFEVEHIFAVMHGQGVGCGSGTGNLDERMRPICRKQVAMSQNERCLDRYEPGFGE